MRTYQIIGPQVVANPKMKNAAITIKAVAAGSVFSGSLRSREKWPVAVSYCSRQGYPSMQLTDTSEDQEHEEHPCGPNDE